MRSSDDLGSGSVLIVDDDPQIAALLEHCLERIGVTSDYVGNGEEALRALSKEHPFRLILLDIDMPGINGFDVLAQIKGLAGAAEIPVMILSGRMREHEVVRGFALGAEDYITKPFRPRELCMRVKRLLSQSHRGAGVLEGQFEGEELLEFLQMLALQRRTGRVEVRVGRLEGWITLFEGEVVGDTTPESALWDLLRLEGGTFVFRPNVPAGAGESAQPRRSLQAVLLEAAALRDHKASEAEPESAEDR